jgi:hypothetical protein
VYNLEYLDELFPLDQAEVTEKGILYNGLIYSCSIAIREQWYLRDFRKIPIYIDNYDAGYILVLLNNGCLTIAYRILYNETWDKQIVQNYQEKICQLREQLKNRKKR